LRGMVSSIAFLVVAVIIAPGLHVSMLFLASLLFACLIFSFLGVLSALLARCYDDMIVFTSVVIMPMAFLGGTFFSLNYLPAALKAALYLLPLTHVSICLRASLLGQAVPVTSYLAMLGFLAAFAGVAFVVLRRRDA